MIGLNPSLGSWKSESVCEGETWVIVSMRETEENVCFSSNLPLHLYPATLSMIQTITCNDLRCSPDLMGHSGFEKCFSVLFFSWTIFSPKHWRITNQPLDKNVSRGRFCYRNNPIFRLQIHVLFYTAENNHWIACLWRYRRCWQRKWCTNSSLCKH